MLDSMFATARAWKGQEIRQEPLQIKRSWKWQLGHVYPVSKLTFIVTVVWYKTGCVQWHYHQNSKFEWLWTVCLCLENQPLPRDERDLPQRPPGQEPEPHDENVPQGVQHLPQDMVPSCWVSFSLCLSVLLSLPLPSLPFPYPPFPSLPSPSPPFKPF